MEREKQSLREFIRNYESGRYASSDVDTMIDAGWFDWFCEDEELKSRLDALFPKVCEIAQSSKVNMDTMYVFFKNNCPGRGELYDDFRICDIDTGDVVFTIIPASGHERDKGLAEVWGQENEFERAIAKGHWHDIQEFFTTKEEKDEYLKFKVVQWFDDEEGEYEAVIDVMLAVSEYHASALLRDRMRYKRYPKGVWLEYFLDGKKILLDARGRIPA